MDGTMVNADVVNFSTLEEESMAAGSFKFEAGNADVAASILNVEDAVVGAAEAGGIDDDCFVIVSLEGNPGITGALFVGKSDFLMVCSCSDVDSVSLSDGVCCFLDGFPWLCLCSGVVV